MKRTQERTEVGYSPLAGTSWQNGLEEDGAAALMWICPKSPT